MHACPEKSLSRSSVNSGIDSCAACVPRCGHDRGRSLTPASVLFCSVAHDVVGDDRRHDVRGGGGCLGEPRQGKGTATRPVSLPQSTTILVRFPTLVPFRVNEAKESKVTVQFNYFSWYIAVRVALLVIIGY